MKKTVIYLVLSVALFQISCKESKKETNTEKKDSKKEIEGSIASVILEKNFQAVFDGKKTDLYWIENKGIKAALTNYGGRIIGLWVKDKEGKYVDVVAGLSSVSGYKKATEPYFGATIGRVGNRIAKGTFTLEGKQYFIPKNNNGNTLHGGIKGFQDVVWKAVKKDEHTLVLTYLSPDGEQGFPGNLNVKVTYSLQDNQTLKMDYEATTDKTTVVNLTNHAFFNLNGEGSGTILNHQLQIYSNRFTPVDVGLIPTGEVRRVAGTPFDFRMSHTIGERIDSDNQQLHFGNGYDHNYELDKSNKEGLTLAANITGDISGITLQVYTQEPGLQFYSGNFMQGKNVFKSGAKDDFRTAFALETQHFPDAPNHKDFESIVLKPGEKYHTVSEYKFSVKEYRKTN